MRQLKLVTLLTGITWSATIGSALATPPPTTAAGIGFDTVFGAGTAALTENGAALFENPGALARAVRLESFLAGSRDFGDLESLRFGSVVPTLTAPTLAVGYTRWWRSDVRSTFGSRGGTGHLGAAWAHRSGLAAGAALKLLNHVEADMSDTSFGLDLGVHWSGRASRGARSAWSHLSAGVALLNAVEPQVQLDSRGASEGRELRAAAAWTHPFMRAWSSAVTLGVQAPRTARRMLSAAARVRHNAGVQLGLGVHDGETRAGIALDRASWRLDYALTAEGTSLGHHVAFHMRLGATVAERRRARARVQELEVASDAARVVVERESAELEGWNLEAQQALAAGRFEIATALFGMVLARRPYDPRARVGIRDARHAAYVSEADSLMQYDDFVGAARALERAVAVVPEDSVSAQRLQAIRVAMRDVSRMRDEVTNRYHDAIDAYAQQRYLEAARVFAEVLKLDPQHPTAASYRQQALNAHGMRVQSAMRSATSHFEADDLGQARIHLTRVLEMDPQNAEAQTLLVQIERRAEAARLAEASRPPQPEPEDASPPAVPTAEVKARYDEGMQLYRSGDLVGAMGAWEEVAYAVPNYEEVGSYLLRVYRVTGLESYTEGRLEEAVEIWDKALQFEPDNRQLRRYLNRAHAKLARARAAEGTGP
jgi:tetratricopeptide (TPR) repeat protein